MDMGRNDIEDPLLTSRSSSSCSLNDMGHRETLIKHSEFAISIVLLAWIHEDSSIKQCSMHICHHAPHISQGIGFTSTLLQLNVFSDGSIPLLRVPFIDAVDLPFLRNLYFRVG